MVGLEHQRAKLQLQYSYACGFCQQRMRFGKEWSKCDWLTINGFILMRLARRRIVVYQLGRLDPFVRLDTQDCKFARWCFESKMRMHGSCAWIFGLCRMLTRRWLRLFFGDQLYPCNVMTDPSCAFRNTLVLELDQLHGRRSATTHAANLVALPLSFSASPLPRRLSPNTMVLTLTERNFA